MMPSKARDGSDPGEKPTAGVTHAQEDSTIAADPIQSEGPERIGPVSSLDELPEVARYLKRIRATPINFRTAVVREMVDGYPKPKGRVAFAGDGAVEVKGQAEAPTEEEQEAITAAFKRVEFPKLVTLTAIAEPPPGVKLTDDKVYVCHDLKGEVAMIHQRYDTRDGGKGFIPWTRWSDGQWRKMEPEVMPFFGVPGYKDKSTLFIHEGAKAAKRMQRLITGELPADRFPWFEQMRYGHHVGWIGGVWALDRSDWEGLAKLGWSKVIVVADNDGGGVDVAAKATGFFRCPTYLLRFDGNFPARFDCGDPWPAEHFDERGQHIGPSYRDCLQPYDRATDLVPITTDSGRIKMVPRLRRAFIDRYRVSTDTQQVFCVDMPAWGQDKKQFNDDVRPRSDDANTYALLVQEDQAVCSKRVYRPDRPSGRLIDKGRVCWNAYEPADIVPVTGEAGPFLDYLAHLFPVEIERHEVMRWIATLIARRDIRMHYSLLLVSKRQGVGKSTLGLILRRLLGEHNVSFPGQSSFESQFNTWANGKLLVFVNEIYTNGNAKVYDKLKNYVTDDDIEINEKNVRQYTIQNWSVFVACSNSHKALFLPDEDRRWLVPTVTEQLRDRSEWEELHAWLDSGGLGIIMWWAEEFARHHAVKKGERPPATAAKRAIVAANKSEGRLLARDFGEEFAGMDPAVVKVSDIRAWVANKRGIDLGHANLEKERLLIDELEAIEGLTVWKGDARPKVGGRHGEKATVVFNFPPPPGSTWGQVEDRLKSLKELGFEPPM
jgi:hypothetical protein